MPAPFSMGSEHPYPIYCLATNLSQASYFYKSKEYWELVSPGESMVFLDSAHKLMGVNYLKLIVFNLYDTNKNHIWWCDRYEIWEQLKRIAMTGEVLVKYVET